MRKNISIILFTALLSTWLMGAYASANYQSCLNDNLMKAATKGDCTQVEKLLESGADINYRDELGETPLIHAAFANRTSVLRVLLRHHADINAVSRQTGTAVGEAAGPGNLQAVKLLVENGADVNIDCLDNPLRLAIEHRHIVIAEYLLSKGSDVNARYSNGETPLHEAIGMSLPADFIALLISKGAQVNAADDFGGTPLMNAARDYNIPLIKMLLKNGADINARDKEGCTSLMLVTLFNCCSSKLMHNPELDGDTADLLIKEGADVKLKDNRGWTALQYAQSVPRWNPRLVTLLKAAETNRLTANKASDPAQV